MIFYQKKKKKDKKEKHNLNDMHSLKFFIPNG